MAGRRMSGSGPVIGESCNSRGITHQPNASPPFDEGTVIMPIGKICNGVYISLVEMLAVHQSTVRSTEPSPMDRRPLTISACNVVHNDVGQIPIGSHSHLRRPHIPA